MPNPLTIAAMQGLKRQPVPLQTDDQIPAALDNLQYFHPRMAPDEVLPSQSPHVNRYESGDQPTIEGSGLTQPNDPNDAGNAKGAYGNNEAYKLAVLQPQLRDAITNARASGGVDINKNNEYLRNIDKDIAENPLTQQAADVSQFSKLLQNANLKGFATPQEQSGYERKQAELNSPSGVENLKGMFGIKQEQERGKWEQGVAHERGVAYMDRTASQRTKDLNDNATKLAVANAHNPAAAAAIRPIQTELGRIHDGIIRGVYTEDDPNVHARLNELNKQLQQYSGGGSVGQPNVAPSVGGGGVHPQADSIAKDLISRYGTNINALLQAAHSEYGGFERPEDEATFKQALAANGAK